MDGVIGDAAMHHPSGYLSHAQCAANGYPRDGVALHGAWLDRFDDATREFTRAALVPAPHDYEIMIG